jgi:hypothetical protein
MIKYWLRRRKTFLGNVGSLCELGQRPRHVGQLVQVGGAVGHTTCTTRSMGALKKISATHIIKLGFAQNSNPQGQYVFPSW